MKKANLFPVDSEIWHRLFVGMALVEAPSLYKTLCVLKLHKCGVEKLSIVDAGNYNNSSANGTEQNVGWPHLWLTVGKRLLCVYFVSFVSLLPK